MLIKCILIRHGKTAGNIARRYMGGRTDESLSEAGMAEVRDMTHILDAGGSSAEKTILVTSPMKRARETAGIMFPGLEQNVVEKLREIDFGVFEGRTHFEMDGEPAYQKWIDSMGSGEIPGGESMDEFRIRSMEGFAKAASAARDSSAETLIITAHGGTLMAVMSVLFGGHYYDYYVNNCEGFVFGLEVDDAGHFAAAGAYDSFCGRLPDGSGDR